MDAPDLLPDALSERYRLIREIGQGGMAVVYLADDLKHSRQVAVKVLRPDVAASIGTERFEREIALAASLQHPHILPLYDSGAVATERGTLLYYVMPFVEGESLRGRMEAEGQLPLDAALDIAREVLDGLAHAHALGVVHRDIKPDNILLSGGHALIADFGIARALGEGAGLRLTQAGSVIGTPAYMSPEQAAGEREADGRSDLYSLACVLYEMLAGEPPFVGRSVQAVVSKRLAEPAPSVRHLRETVPDEVDRALARALARTPSDRFATAREFRTALRPGLQTPAGAPPAPGRRPLPWAALLLLAAAALVATVVLRRDTAAEGRPPKLALTDLTAARDDPSTGYLQSGIPDYLVSALLRLPGLEVVPMSLVRRGAGRDASPLDIGRQLGVGAVLTGSLSRFGGRLAINFELVGVPEGTLLWSGQFEYPDTDYAGIIPAVVSGIADSLRLQLSHGARSAALAGSTVDPVTLDLVLRGQYAYMRGAAGAVGDSAIIDSMRTYFERVLERNPGNPRALAGLGDFYTISFIRGWDVPGLSPEAAHARGDSLTRRALAADSTILGAWLAVGISRLYLEDDFEGARQAFERIAASDSGSAGAQRMLGVISQELDGDLPTALRHFQAAVDIEPTVLALNSDAAGLMAARRYGDAVPVLEQSMALRPSVGASTRLITAYERLGRYADAVRVRRLADPSGASAAPFEAALAAGDTAAYAAAQRREWRRTADSLTARLARADVTPAERYNVAELRIGALLCELGDSKKAMDLVRDLYQIRPGRLRWIVTNVDLDCLRQDPRYLPMVKAAGLE
ncbi:MAG TPA: protein kinase, partial [Gemmatimonadales bacterium]|nr:protein kinase [Gemmatimonadales bacterium]